MKDRILCAFLLADIRSSDSSQVFKASNCRVYRFSPSSVEILVPEQSQVNLSSLLVTLNLSGLLALNVPAVVKRRVEFPDYALLELTLNPGEDTANDFALRRIYESIRRRQTIHVDLNPFLTSLGLEDVNFCHRDGFVASHPRFEIRVKGTVLESSVYTILGMADYQAYLAVSYIAANKIIGEFGYFDRALDLTSLEGKRLGPLDALLSYEAYVWARGSGLRRSYILASGEYEEFDAEGAFSTFSCMADTPDADSEAWVLTLDRLLHPHCLLASSDVHRL